MKIEIEIVQDNLFNKGWLGYLLGLPEPTVEDSPDEHDGWVMGQSTPDLKMIRRVFTSQSPDDPQYVVTARDKVRIVVGDE